MADIKPYNEIIENVTLCFAKIAESGKKFESEDREYSVNVTVNKQTAKDFKKKFTKQPIKEFDNADYEVKFGIKVPYPEQDEQFVIKLSKGHIINGVEFYNNKFRPQAYLVNQDSTLTCITTSRLIANGSIGDVAYRVTTNKFGTFAHLEGVRITNLIEYRKSSNLLNLFGGVVSVIEEEDKSVSEARKSREEKETPVPPQQLSNTGFDPSDMDDQDLPF